VGLLSDACVREALSLASVDSRIRQTRPFSGGSVGEVLRVDLSDGRALVAKIHPAQGRSLLDEELHGLRSLADTFTVPVPEPVGLFDVGAHAVLLMECLETTSPSPSAWSTFAQSLAQLHRHPTRPMAELYGFDRDNHCGATPQPNTPTDDWVQFNQQLRLGYQVELARAQLRASETTRIEKLIARLGELLPARPPSGLLHGDLWDGNSIATNRGIALIDPAPYHGDGWADIAMMQLFGGYPAECFAAYTEANDDREGIDERIAIYQLYHVLNHLNLFGRGYASQAMSLVRRLGF